MRLSLLAAGVAAIAVSTACGNERSITTEPVGALGFGTNFLRTSTNLPRGTVTYPVGIVASATPANDSVIMVLAGLDTLTTGSYTVWFANDSATKFVRSGVHEHHVPGDWRGELPQRWREHLAPYRGVAHLGHTSDGGNRLAQRRDRQH
jgi:hypothetical protein